MKHKLTLFSIAMMVLAIPQSVKAYDFSATLFGNTLYFEIITDSTCRIVCPTGDYNHPWAGYTQPSGMLQIPDEVYASSGAYQITEIGQYAFSGTNITSLYINSNHLTKIKHGAFSDCIYLITVNLNTSSLTNLIANNIFKNCANLNSVTLPNNLCIIADGMFQDCIQLNSIMLPDSISHIGGSAFKNTWLSSISIPDKVSSIGVSAFADCPNLQSVLFGKSVKFIGQHAFNNCSNVQTIVSKPNNPPYFRTIVYDSYVANVNLGGGHTDYACGDIPTSTTIHIVCGKTSMYQSWWNTTNYTFVEDIVYNLSVSTSDSTMGIAQILQSPSCSQDAIIEAQANNGYHFVGWSDSNTDNPRTLSITTDMDITALFAENTITTNALMKKESNIATLYALPQVGVQFKGWSDGATENPHTVIVTSDTIVNAIYGALDSIRIYDTVFVYDTVINIMRDTTIYNHYFYDTVLTYDTIVVYDTTRLYDTLSVINIDTLHHYYYDTTIVQNTIFDTTRVFDTLFVVNIDTLHHYYYDTTIVQNTIFDTTRVFDTLFVVNIDTLHHYYNDTTIVQNTIFDTTHVYNTIYDTTIITHYFFDSTWVFDTIYLVDTIHIYDTIFVGVNEVDAINAKIYISRQQIVVEGADGNTVRLYDINGHMLATKQDEYTPLRFDVPVSGAYLVKIGDHPARKVVVIR